MKSVGECHRAPARRKLIPLAGLLLLLCTFALGQEDRRVVIGGWGGVGYFDDERESTLRTFDAHPLYLYFSAKPKPGWSFFAEFEGEHQCRQLKECQVGKLTDSTYNPLSWFGSFWRFSPNAFA